LRKAYIKKYLDELYENYQFHYSSRDPIWQLHKTNNEREIETIGLIASCYSYGNIKQINKFQKEISKIGDDNIYDFVINFSYKKDLKYLKSLDYRFNKYEDLGCLIANIKNAIDNFGSLKNLFLNYYSEKDINILNALTKFSYQLKQTNPAKSNSYSYLLPDVTKKSTCKRLNLFLRWMVRKDEIDLGIWSNEVNKSKLIIPVDTHVYKVSRELGLMKRKSCDMKFAIELTEKLKEFNPGDPVKYDFALCHIGVDKKNPQSKPIEGQ
jgi:uncharacterized protein (TIGR02757 family)